MSEDSGPGSQTLFFTEGGIEHFGNGVHLLRLFANTCIIETDEGVVLFDVGLEFNGPRIVEEVRAITDKPVRYIVYGHGHADHAFGAQAILADAEVRGHPRPVILAHENVVKRFDRYQEMLPYHEHINRIQFGIPEDFPAFSRIYIYPDETYSDATSFTLGGIVFELRHAMGETDDATWMWVPELDTVCVSDLWVWSCPNVGNPFKVQRYALEWAEALEAVAALSPGLMLPGHGGVIANAEKVKDACLTVAGALRFLNDQVVAMLNEGKWQEEILRSFEWPAEFAESPYLAPVYGHPYFIVQALLRRYHGWFDGNASHLFPSSGSEIAGQVLGLAGGPDKVLDRARALAQEGKTQLALHLVDFVLDGAAGPRTDALELKAECLNQLADLEKSFIARNIFLGGVRQINKLLGKQ
jgi:alkyl sulfatase BDS1-like metallo-beta-lactamase superfamily hydrolase